MLLLISLAINAVGGLLLWANFYYAGKYFTKAFELGDTSNIMFRHYLRVSYGYMFFGQWIVVGMIVANIAAADTWGR